jgi:hypothetical protein
MFKVKPYLAILEKTDEGYSLFFPDLPGAISTGEDYEEAVENAKECLSFSIYPKSCQRSHIRKSKNR